MKFTLLCELLHHQTHNSGFNLPLLLTIRYTMYLEEKTSVFIKKIMPLNVCLNLVQLW